jgi:hypothetical protein
MTPFRFAVVIGAVIAAVLASPSVADVISDWSTAVAPPPPELKEVTVEPATTALLLLDIMKAAAPRGRAASPRCRPSSACTTRRAPTTWWSGTA